MPLLEGADAIASPVSSGRYVICAPCASGTSRPVANSNVWCSGSTDSIPSLTPNSKIFDSSDTMNVKFRWVSITPLGLPVVPDVKISDASASGLCRRSSPAARARSTSMSGSANAVANGQSLVAEPRLGQAARQRLARCVRAGRR